MLTWNLFTILVGIVVCAAILHDCIDAYLAWRKRRKHDEE